MSILDLIDVPAKGQRQAWTDTEIEDAVAVAQPVVLRGLLFCLAGDEHAAATRVEKRGSGVFAGFAVHDPDDVELLREKARDFLFCYRDSGASAIAPDATERFVRSMSLTVGEDIPGDETEMWLEELGVDPWALGVNWTGEPNRRQVEAFPVIVIGAGMGGLNVAVHLKRAGIPFTLLERDAGVGGTWFQNRYPGARVDTASRTYTHTWALEFEWPAAYAPQPDNLRYLNWIADKFDLRRHIVLDTEVVSMDWDEHASRWDVTVRSNGETRVLLARAVISSVGIFTTPNVPEFEGAARFGGPAFHSARWPEGLTTAGKRVAVIGTGCSGYQMVPEIARDASQVTVFQRTPQWCVPNGGYLTPFKPAAMWLDRNFPMHKQFQRLRDTWLQGPRTRARMMDIDPDWDDPLTLSAANKQFRDESVSFIYEKLGDVPELAERMVPPHPIMSSRPVIVDSGYSIFDVLRQNVSLVSDEIAQITEQGIVTSDGTEHKADMIVYATGFRTNDFLWPIDVRGRGGVSLQELWAPDGPRAYLGTMLPGFPNFFMIFGPNTTPQGGVSLVNSEAITTRYILSCIAHLIEDDRNAIEPTRQAYDNFNEELDGWEARKIYSDKRANTYFQSEFGRSIVNCPFPGIRKWELLRRPNLDELDVR